MGLNPNQAVKETDTKKFKEAHTTKFRETDTKRRPTYERRLRPSLFHSLRTVSEAEPILQMTRLPRTKLVRMHMTFASYLQQHAKACLKLSETADEPLSDRIKDMAEDLLQKAREAEDGIQKDWTAGALNHLAM